MQTKHLLKPSAKGNPFLSFRAIPFLVVLAGGLAIQPAVGASPVFKTIVVTSPGKIVGLIADPTRSVVYAADKQNSRVAVIDTTSNQIKSFITTTNPPVGLALSPDSNTLYVTDQSNFLEAISLINFESLYVQPVDPEPGIPAASSDGSTVYVPCSGGTGTVVPVGGPLLGTSIKIGNTPTDVVFNQNNTFAYVTNITDKISVINTATGAVTTFSTPKPTFGLLVNGKTLYAAGEDVVYVINTSSNKIIDTIKLPKPPGSHILAALPALTPDGAFLYIPLVEVVTPSTVPDTTVVAIDTRTNHIHSKFTVGQGPVQVAAAANGLFGYSSNEFDGTVSVFDLAQEPF